jgi:hypothetical protein
MLRKRWKPTVKVVARCLVLRGHVEGGALDRRVHLRAPAFGHDGEQRGRVWRKSVCACGWMDPRAVALVARPGSRVGGLDAMMGAGDIECLISAAGSCSASGGC